MKKNSREEPPFAAGSPDERSSLPLTARFAQQMLPRTVGADPVIGRQKELETLIRILCRKRKNNAALVGEPGVGKTAVVEELARRMARGAVPVQLQHKRLFCLNVAALVAGTKYRGEFEARVRDLLEEISGAGDVILFVDEMHLLVGAGAAEGAIDAANLLKPALGRGRLQMIGATTCREYRKHVASDAALERRFQVLRLEEPSAEQTDQILRALRPGLEAFHRVRIADTAIRAATALSVRYLTDRFLPDKALDLLDESAAAASLGGEAAVVDRQTVARIVAEKTGVPVGRVDAPERTELLALEARLKARIVGQDAAVRTVAAAVRRGRAGLADSRRPTAAILLAGPTGVGKTALCKALAEALYGSESAMVRLDMSEYAERHTVSRLLGAPPGYLGHGEGGILTEKVRQRPCCLLLLDELEKAHRDVTAILLQILEDGILTDAEGRTVDFRNTLILMTTNAGSGPEDPHPAGFGARQSDGITAGLEACFPRELLGRIDAVALFSPLREPELRQIAAREIRTALERAGRAGLSVRLQTDAAAIIASRCRRGAGGARQIRHLVRELVENPLADLLLQTGGGCAELCCEHGTLRLRAVGLAPCT